MKLSVHHKQLLLGIARDSIHGAVRNNPADPESFEAPDRVLQTNCGVFVSVYVAGELRGCLGTFSEDEPLWKNVRRLAASAATEDHRFRPLLPEDMEELRIEISVLSPRQKIRNISEIQPGKHGIYIQKGLNRGTLLPQVATAQGWDAEEFLGNCARYKAGIGWDGWKTADIYIYEALVFSSDEIAC